jgi:hypothetical protein
MSLPECEHMIRALNDRKDELLNQSLLVEYKLLKEFLTQLKRIKDDELIRLKRETSVIQDDLNLVESLVENVQQMKIEVADPDDPEGKIYTGIQSPSDLFIPQPPFCFFLSKFHARKLLALRNNFSFVK